MKSETPIIKNILVVVDMQNDFVYGKFKNKNAEKIISKINYLISTYPELYDNILFTKDLHSPEEFKNGTLQSYEGKTFSQHCLCNSGGADLVYPFKDFLIEGINEEVYKNHFDGSKRIEDRLIEFYRKDVDKVKFNYTLCGVCTDICVLATAIGLTNRISTNQIEVLSCACAGTSPKAHKTALAAMKPFGIKIY
jgi:nicotinamidase-related amidase